MYLWFTPRRASSLKYTEVIICLGCTSQCTSVQPTWNSKETSSLPSRRSSSLFGLAPDGGCPAAGIAACTGGLLHHHFTLTPGGAVCFCGPIRQISPPRTLSGITLNGVRTFLTPEGGVTTWLTWGLHHNMFEKFLEGKGRWYINTKNMEGSIFQNHQWGGQIALNILKCPFETVRNDWRNTLGIKIITKTRKTERKTPVAEPYI